MQNVLQGALQRSPGGGTQETYITMEQYNQWLNNMVSNFPAFNPNNPWAQLLHQHALSGEPMIGTVRSGGYGLQGTIPSEGLIDRSGGAPHGVYSNLFNNQSKGKSQTFASQPVMSGNTYGAQRNPLQEAIRRLLGGM